ncbi:MAG: galactokinase [Firmicutes bacterium]|nr:galactokinase [Bacillota bacterium]
MLTQKLILKPADRAVLDAGFAAQFGGKPEAYFSAPGRTEIGGNHTDHQHGRVLAGAVDLDTLAAVRVTGGGAIRVLSQGYPLCTVSLDAMEPQPSEQNTTAALVRGVAARFAQLGASVQGFDAYVTSTVLPGSGLSSSAAFEVLMGTICNCLFLDGKLPAPEIAKIGQYAENVYFGKPCGLMDQMASAVGNLVSIDFSDVQNPVITPIAFDFSACGYALCIIDSKASHADLTEEYAAIPAEMKAVAAHFGAEVLRQVPEETFYAAIPALRQECGDRAVLRAVHFYQDNRRVAQQVQALTDGDFDAFLRLVRQSGESSWMYLQNVIPAGYMEHQDMAIALALCQKLLDGRGAFRVHGGGFAGTVQAFVPADMLEGFRAGIDSVLGRGACHVLSIRPWGGVQMEVQP